MNVFKDVLRVVALVLVARAVYTDSVACAISAGTLYMGGFEGVFHLKNFVKSKRDPVELATEPAASTPAPDMSNIVHFKRR